MKYVMGIDPGKSGGIVILSDDDDEAPRVLSLSNKSPTDIWEWLLDQPEPKRCYIEKVGAMPGQGVTSMFSFGEIYGFLQGFMISRGIPLEHIKTPADWQKALGLIFKNPSKKDSKGNKKPDDQYKAEMGRYKTMKKNKHKERAQLLFPEVEKITHATADALLIAYYGQKMERGVK